MAIAATFGAPPAYANRVSSPSGAVPAVPQFTQTFGGGLQGTGAYNSSTISVPAAAPAPSTTLASVPPNPFATPVTATKPSTAVIGPAPAFRQVVDGQVFTDPVALAQYQAAHSFQPVAYNGQTYTDPAQYANAVLSDAQAQHDQAVKQINTAHQNGLISFEQQQKLIDQSRTNLKNQLNSTLGSQAGYINQISPDATQSQQGVLAQQSTDQYNQGLGQINDQQTNLGTAQNDFENNFQNSLASADKSLTGVKDQLANQATARNLAAQSTLDAGQNAALAFQNQLAQYQNQAANASQPTVTQFDPLQLAQGIGTSFINANAAGVSADQAAPAIVNALAGQGIDTNSAQFQNIMNYVKGQIGNPATSYGLAYKNKTPLPVSGQ